VLWLCSQDDSNFFEKAFEALPCTYIADGHHRAASSFNVGKLRREEAKEKGVEITGEEPFMYFMAIHYPESNLKILDYNRVLKSINDLTESQFLEKIGESYDISGPLPQDSDPKPKAKGECSLYIGK
jgi:uncharacterized protein (DUF1015 family)